MSVAGGSVSASKLRLHHALDDSFQGRRVLFDERRTAGKNAVGVALAVKVGAVREHVRALYVVEQRRAIGLDRADPVDRACLEGFDGFRCVAHVADVDVLEGHAMLLEPVVGKDFEGIELERAKRLALEFFSRVEAGPRDDDAALDAATGNDLDRCAGVIEGHEARVGHEAEIDLANAEERDLFGKRRRVDELDLEAVFLCQLFGVGEEQVEVAKTGAVRRLERTGRFGLARHEPGHYGHCQRHRAARPEQAAPVGF